MASVNIAGIKVPVLPNKSGQLVFPSRLVETDSVVSNLQKILYPMLEGLPVLLVGDAGVGKNALIYHINSKREAPTIRFSFNEDSLPEDLIGSYRIQGKSFVWNHGPLSQALEWGTTFVADEMNLCPPNILRRFASVYEGSYLDLLEGNGSRLGAKLGFWFVGTQNPSEGFEGRKPLPFDITKHFAVIYLDPYSPEELLFILKKLFPNLREEFLKGAIQLTLDSEFDTKQGRIGRGDLEKYHFNLRTLQRFCKRIESFGKDEPAIYAREASYLYIEPFRKDEDRLIQQDRIHKIFGKNPITSQSSGYVQGGFLFWNDKQIASTNESHTIKVLASHPTPLPIQEFLDKLTTCIQMGENVLIEARENQDPLEFFSLITELQGDSAVAVAMSKGMHTSDVVGALKPTESGEPPVAWTDGPLTRALRVGKSLWITGLDAAGAELVEKLNMLTDDARAILLPPEASENGPIVAKPDATVFGYKTFRESKNTQTISRAFRNRFTSILFPELEDIASLKEILEFYLPEGKLVNGMLNFHLRAKELAKKRTIGSANIQPYQFGLGNLLRWKTHIQKYNAPEIHPIIFRGGQLFYTNQISDPKERKDLEKLLQQFLNGMPESPDLFLAIEDKKKTLSPSQAIQRARWWNPEDHFREPNTGMATKWNPGSGMQKGIEINTPETGGDTKEGPDAWYGQNTQGNQGQGEPSGGGGAWGFRTEELYKQFLKKRRLLWDYSMVLRKSEFDEAFGKELEEVELDLENLFDPEIDIHRLHRREGSRVDARKYLSYLAGKGDAKIFDRTSITKEEEKLKGVEVVFLISKCRRIFNFDYSVAMLSAILVSLHILEVHNVETAVYGYSDLKNTKSTIDLVLHKELSESFEGLVEERVFQALCRDWQGDSIPEYQLLDDVERFYSQDSKTKILVLLSDFRGNRAKASIEDEIKSFESRKCKEAVIRNESKGYVLLGVGLGSRFISEHLFQDNLQITSENFFNMPKLIGGELARLILLHHKV